MSLTANLELLTPEFALAGLAFLVFIIDLVLPEDRKNLLGWISIVGLIALIVVSIFMLWDHDESLYNGLLAVDDFSLWFKVLFMGIGVAIILSSMDFVNEHLDHKGEFYGIVLFSILGMNVVPDVYEGAPYPVTAYLAIGSKAAAFALVLRLAAEAFVPAANRWDEWQLIVAVLAAVTMLVGNLVALAQRNIKRLMAYSSIAHVGFILAGVAALSQDSALASNSVMLYLVGYSVTSLVVFGGLIAFFNMTGREMIADFAGVADKNPFLAASIAIGMFSLGGLPIFAGFAIKFYLFTAVANEGLLWLAGLAIFSSVISLYYYLQVIRQMYIQPAAEPEAEASDEEPDGFPALAVAKSISAPLMFVLAVGLAATFWIGVYPAPLLDTIEAATPGHFARDLDEYSQSAAPRRHGEPKPEKGGPRGRLGIAEAGTDRLERDRAGIRGHGAPHSRLGHPERAAHRPGPGRPGPERRAGRGHQLH